MLCSSASVSVPPLSILFLFLIFPFFLLQVQATVPPSKTFKYVNQGEFGEYVVEYDASYRVLDVFTFPFQLCFYNTTPDAFTLALRMGTRRSESIMRWVWEANLGNPVRENATLTFGRDGNLVLANADGRVVWQTATANKGVVGFKLLPSGNIVLHDKQGRFVWQSFDHPTDTLLVGQELRLGGPTKVVSRVSSVDGSQGPYSLVLEQNRVALYLKSNNSPKPLLYYYDELGSGQDPLAYVKFNSEPETEEAYAFDLEFDYAMINSSSVSRRIWARPKYNATYSMLRVESDGNLKIYTYSDKVDWGAWEVTFTLFDRDGSMSECKLPTRCGSLGVCEDDQCVACPTPLGLTWWSKNCAPPALPPCKSRANVTNYYKIVGVEHFLNEYTEGDGPMKLAECRDKCNKDCGCLGFFYREESSKCLMAPELGTLTKVSNTSHIAFIKLSK
ncbi:PREDICTED: epidermis-specific secreted glycoprotein EP1-like [Nelumbo nucifera]|uniref:Epidermis-specific secreted glycoprotein EP1-like n=1 Tax=Nelumbo nucifera TaxID=4432 RepID=A0A1U8BG67_NELNU|nr:PREDICTED: epidermis-specific secreted glycoprotein EP1-like [Nelumbo nucifera]